MKRKSRILAMLALVGSTCVIGCRAHRAEALTCQSNMAQLYGAAVSCCLEKKLSAETPLEIADVGSYVRPEDLVCPSGGVPYPSFRVVDGPVCPNGHTFLPDEPRPLRSKPLDLKLAGLYRESGLTNLIVNPAEQPVAPANAEQRAP